MLAHELRNPLAPIRNVAYVLSKGGADPATVRRSGQMIERQASHLTHLVDDLLDVARITRGRVALHREPLSLDTVVDAALETVQPVLDARYQSIWCASAGEKIFVDGDSVRLCQVLANLLTNASKYSPERARIEIVIDGSAVDAIVEVRDPGAGIDAQLLPHLFDLFLQGDRTLDRAQGGLGVGLTIVKLLVEMHGGPSKRTAQDWARAVSSASACRGTAAGGNFLAGDPGGTAASAAASRPDHRRQCRRGRIHASAAAHRRPSHRAGV